MTRHRIYTEGENGEQIDITPLTWWAKNTTLRWRMLKWRIRYNRRLVLTRAWLRNFRAVR